MQTHFGIVLNEHEEGDYSVCDTCRSRTLLVYPGSCWNVDGEPYRSGESDKNAPADIEIDAEISGHYCPSCRRLTSLSINTD